MANDIVQIKRMLIEPEVDLSSQEILKREVERRLEDVFAKHLDKNTATVAAKHVQEAIRQAELTPGAMREIDEWVEATKTRGKDVDEKAKRAGQHVRKILRRALELAGVANRDVLEGIVDRVMNAPDLLTRVGWWVVEKGGAMLKDLMYDYIKEKIKHLIFGDEHQTIEEALGKISKVDLAELRIDVKDLEAKIDSMRNRCAIEGTTPPLCPACPHSSCIGEGCTEPLVLRYAPDQRRSTEITQIEVFADRARANPSKLVIVRAHTDTMGTKTHNSWLARERAAAVVATLIAKHEDLKSRIKVAAFGENQLRLETADNQSESRNRVVVLTLEVP